MKYWRLIGMYVHTRWFVKSTPQSHFVPTIVESGSNVIALQKDFVIAFVHWHWQCEWNSSRRSFFLSFSLVLSALHHNNHDEAPRVVESYLVGLSNKLEWTHAIIWRKNTRTLLDCFQSRDCATGVHIPWEGHVLRPVYCTSLFFLSG